MKSRILSSVRAAARRLANAVTHNFALKLLSLLLATVIYLMIKPNAVATTPAVEKMAKAIAVGAGMEKPEPETNTVQTVTAPPTNAVQNAASPLTNTTETATAPATEGAPDTNTNGKD